MSSSYWDEFPSEPYKDAGADISLQNDRKTIKNVVLQEIAISLWKVYQIQSITWTKIKAT